jgi:hypothetical protein
MSRLWVRKTNISFLFATPKFSLQREKKITFSSKHFAKQDIKFMKLDPCAKAFKFQMVYGTEDSLFRPQ